ncbi:(2Fe-2S) ferredoxin domain-containing protein [Aminomonas paucivorans]|uniref:(2Fe-2S) ferredoxin domain-containing protein n=1 Tax=Aminomonas paucivorans TaxID=81412 RepID=UPI00331EB7DF
MAESGEPVGSAVEKGERVVLTLCMGSSCFARGNQKNLEVIRQFLKDHRMEDRVSLVGSRCEGACTQGPNLRIGDRLFPRINQEDLPALLERELL